MRVLGDMVDAVIAWVDGADPEHRRMRQLHAKSESTVDLEANAATRFADNGELRYCIQLIRKNAPWISKIFLITDAQCPSWLDKRRQVELGVTLVDHKVLFRGYEEVLPIFNSLAIETVMYRIPSLDKRFIYFNDDCFVIRPVLEMDFFANSVPLIRGFSFSRNKLLREIDRLLRPQSFRADGWVGTNFGQEDGISLKKKVKLAHTPHPINRRDYAALMENDGRIERNIPFRFRNSSQFGPIPLYASAGLKSGRTRIVPRDDFYLDPKNYDHIISTEIEAKIGVPCIRHMCVQSLDEFSPNSQDEIYTVLDKLVAA